MRLLPRQHSSFALFCALLYCVPANCRAQAAEAHPSPRTVPACATCHPAQSKPQPQTSMAHAMELPAECAILKAHPLLTFQNAGYSYRIERKGDQSIYTVTNGRETLIVPLGWAFGLGRAGQTYVFEKDGALYESRVSYFEKLDGLDITLGAAKIEPANLSEAAGRIMSGEDARCFGCHATHATNGQGLNLHGLTPGIQCERCHGSADAHVKGFAQGSVVKMPSLRKLSAEDTSEFCGQCHRTWSEIAGGGMLGIANIRFQPYRLTGSRCYDSDDDRIRCTACHDPHREVDTLTTDYDARCQACHNGGKAEARHCPRAASNCVSCHMPKLEMPGSHHKFTDHQIRIVRANAPYPN